jgi:multicomponent K+:H+ antiporter subunit E
MARLIPHPSLSVAMALAWLMLAGSWTLGSLILATAVGILVPLATARWWPGRPRLKSHARLASYVALVLWDILKANIAVARIVLFMPADRIRSAWIAVPLDLTSPEAIALLAGTITMTPGTLTADMSACGRVLLIHSLHARDPDAIRDEIKTRYEARLKEIFP